MILASTNMARIAGVDIPNEKRIDIALTYLYGIGRKNVVGILAECKIDAHKRTKELTDEEFGRIQKIVDASFKVEGDLRQEVAENIKRLKMISSYRGMRHARNLPVRGQRTRVNARTKRGKRQTVGALRKETRAKIDQTPTKPAAEASAKPAK